MEKDEDEILVTITGKNSFARELATGLVQVAFGQGGFDNVVTLNPAGEAIIYPEVSSMYDLVQAHAPHLFKASVKIQGSFPDFQNPDLRGAFGPIPVGHFAWMDGQLEDINSLVDIDETPPDVNNNKNVFTLYAAEKDVARIEQFRDIEMERIAKEDAENQAHYEMVQANQSRIAQQAAMAGLPSYRGSWITPEKQTVEPERKAPLSWVSPEQKDALELLVREKAEENGIAGDSPLVNAIVAGMRGEPNPEKYLKL